jgi:tetratricopeptide (TPR) repeat protein
MAGREDSVARGNPGIWEARLEQGHELYVRGLLALRDGDPNAAIELLLAASRQLPAHQGVVATCPMNDLSECHIRVMTGHASTPVRVAPVNHVSAYTEQFVGDRAKPGHDTGVGNASFVWQVGTIPVNANVDSCTRGGDGAACEASTIPASRLLTDELRLRRAGISRNLLRAFIAAGRFQQALEQADVCLTLAPNEAEFHFARGTALNGLGKPAAACAALTRAVTLRPDHAPSLLNLANAWVDLDDLEVAEELCRRATRLDPQLIEARASLGFILTAQGRLSQAIAACESAIELSPEYTPAHWNLAVAALLSGDLGRGFAEYEWRKRHLPFCRDFAPLPGPQWDGSDPAGQTILVRAEQGFGDIIQFARYLPVIREAGGIPVLVCPAAIAPLIRAMPGAQVVSRGEALPRYDAWIDQMSLPRVFHATLETLPGASGYLQADPARVAAWRATLPVGRKVGVVLAGNALHGNDRRRSIPLRMVFPLPEIPSVTYINLHHGPTAAGLGLPDLTARLRDYAETAALLANLDLTVTVDTSIAHLAGAMGRPAWVLLPAAPDWRWLLQRADSPWYASLRLLRQQRAGDWAALLAKVMRELPRFLRSLPAG